MKTLIVYYSYTGNTKKIAEMIQNNIGGDIIRIEPVNPYNGDYNTVAEQGHNEVKQGYMPEIKSLNININNYDTIILGTPVWWYTFAPAVKTFLKNTEFSGKTVYPFATNGGWIGHTFEDIEKVCKNGKVKSGINIRFNNDKLITPVSDIENWIKKINV